MTAILTKKRLALVLKTGVLIFKKVLIEKGKKWPLIVKSFSWSIKGRTRSVTEIVKSRIDHKKRLDLKSDQEKINQSKNTPLKNQKSLIWLTEPTYIAPRSKLDFSYTLSKNPSNPHPLKYTIVIYSNDLKLLVSPLWLGHTPYSK